MQLADRWLGIGSVVLALGAAGVALRPHHRCHRAKVAHVDLHRTNCNGLAAITLPPPPIDNPVPEVVDPYVTGLAALDVSDCLGSATRVDMLIEISADGRVVTASHRPEKPTAASRCIAKQVRQLEFPAGPSRISIRYAFTK